MTTKAAATPGTSVEVRRTRTAIIFLSELIAYLEEDYPEVIEDFLDNLDYNEEYSLQLL